MSTFLWKQYKMVREISEINKFTVVMVVLKTTEFEYITKLVCTKYNASGEHKYEVFTLVVDNYGDFKELVFNLKQDGFVCIGEED